MSDKILYMYEGNEKQLVEHGFIVQDDIIEGLVLRYATRDFKHVDDAVGITLKTNNDKIAKEINEIKVIYNPYKNEGLLKSEIKDLIDSGLVKVKKISGQEHK